MSDNINNNISENNITNHQPKERKGLFQNIYFVGFLLIISILDCIRYALQYDYRIVNIIFIAFSAFLFFKILQNKKKLKT